MATLLAQSVPWYDGEPHPVFQRKRLAIANLELGLRWLHDRTNRHTFGSFLGEFFRGAVEAYTDEEAINVAELGLRWLHDRAASPEYWRKRAFWERWR